MLYEVITDSFKQDAIDTLVKRMSDDKGKFIVIAAGYVITSYSIHYTKLYEPYPFMLKCSLSIPVFAGIVVSLKELKPSLFYKKLPYFFITVIDKVSL